MSTDLRQNTATTITVGPFLDKTDGITPEVSLTVTSCHLTLMVDNPTAGAGSPTLALDANATASGGNNDMVHVTNDDAGYYTLELTAANTNYVGTARLSINDVATHCPVFHEFNILPTAVWDAKYGGDYASAAVIAAAVNGESLVDSIPADGVLPTVRQALYMLIQFLTERSVSGTTVTVKKVNGSTTLFTLTLNDATTPTAITRAT